VALVFNNIINSAGRIEEFGFSDGTTLSWEDVIKQIDAVDNKNAAAGIVGRLERAMAMLADNPKAGPARTDLGPDIRGFPVGNCVPDVDSSGVPLASRL
jgi:hypothetical protein